MYKTDSLLGKNYNKSLENNTANYRNQSLPDGMGLFLLLFPGLESLSLTTALLGSSADVTTFSDVGLASILSSMAMRLSISSNFHPRMNY